MEIVEGLCDSSSFECNQMVEEHEDLFETWWFKRWAELNASGFRNNLSHHISPCVVLVGKQKIPIFINGSALRT